MTSPAASGRHLSKFEKRPKMPHPTALFALSLMQRQRRLQIYRVKISATFSNQAAWRFTYPYLMVGFLSLFSAEGRLFAIGRCDGEVIGSSILFGTDRSRWRSGLLLCGRLDARHRQCRLVWSTRFGRIRHLGIIHCKWADYSSRVFS